ncbi:hypothetical protein WR25_07913 [Diploscapter pachys]|uniref:Uncharacterized protein n=1 Tax=Diploscapter pachys TaxID=2018661 RepID=A0A2A2M2C5_9BILA|nr:hypothetical protein WR25_07913 [Diploscapter pachys]
MVEILEGAALAIRREATLGDRTLRLAVGPEQRDAAVVIALDRQLLRAVDDVSRLHAVHLRDRDVVALAVDRRIGLGGLAAEGEREIAERHQDRAELHRALGPQILVRQIAADQRRQVHERGIAAIQASRCTVAEQEMLRQIERQQRAHAVIAEAFPHFGGEQARELAGMAEPGLFGGRIDMADVRLAAVVRGRGVHHSLRSLNCAASLRTHRR